MTHSCDVAVIGGGPAGSTAAYALAKKGWRVVLFEKERHPRFHIGESLLPMNQPVFEQIGVLDEVERIGVYKPGAEFYDVDPKQPPHRFYFRDALDKNFPDAYQVRRDQLDEVLLRNCERNGATVCEESRVTAVDFAADGAGATLAVQPKQGDAQTWAARYVVDASGRDAMLGGKFGIKRKNQRHASAAIFGHFDGVPRNPGPEAGLISVCWFEHGWIWFIPLPDGMMSVGAVCSPGLPEDTTRQHRGLSRADPRNDAAACAAAHGRCEAGGRGARGGQLLLPVRTYVLSRRDSRWRRLGLCRPGVL